MTGIGDRTGEVLTFEVPPSWDLPAYALHDIGIGEVVTIARELGYAGEIVTVGIEVGEIQAFSRDIDPAVEEGIRVAEQKILTILREWIGDQGMRS
jgi:hydrogenase maturation protease